MAELPNPEQMARIVLHKDAPPDLVRQVTELIALRDEAMRSRGEVVGAQKAREAVAKLLGQTAEALGHPDVVVKLRETVLAVDRAASGMAETADRSGSGR